MVQFSNNVIHFFTYMIPFLHMSLFQMFYYFCFWSVFGWFLEVIVRSVETGAFENRGFLNGAFCPIYGFGVLGVIVLFRGLVNHEVLLFFASAIVCTALEWLVGKLLLVIFNTRWWDYSHYKFKSSDGLVSLASTLLWGFGCVLMMKFAQPLVEKGVSYIPIKLGIVLILLIFAMIVTDTIVTLNEVRELSYNLGKLQELADFFHNSSIMMGEKVSDTTLNLKSKYDQQVVQYNLLVKEIKSSRITNAFPNMEHLKYKIRPYNLKEIPTSIREKVSDKVFDAKERIFVAKEKISNIRK
ncbi:MAG: putative ABC transporter permease [Ruminococcus sp.]|nr:putative ABC transporter permease [Ruminococcus sp.]